MYPHVIQFETRKHELEQRIQLNRDRTHARAHRRTIEPCSEKSAAKSLRRPVPHYEHAG